MADLSFIRRRKIQIYLLAALILLCCLMLVACNADTSTNVENVSKPTHFMAKFMDKIDGLLGDGVSFGWTVVLFTVFLRLILSPLDIWQKIIARKNSKAMERMKPQLEALQAKFGDDKQRLQQEQMALYKKEKYSTLGMCLPTIVTLVVFFIVFAGFRQTVGYQFAMDYHDSKAVFDASISQQIEESAYGDANGDGVFNVDDVPKTEEGAEFYSKSVDVAQQKVYDSYFSKEKTSVRSWLWIKNIFVGDNWYQAVPDFATVTGQSGFATSRLTGLTNDEYKLVMGKVLGQGGWGKNGKWNGWLLLPVLSVALSFLSTKLLSKAQGQPPAAPAGGGGDAQNQSMKMMQWVMPVMMGVFGLLYSGAFALYMFTSSLTAIVFQLLFNLVGRLLDRSKGRAPRAAKR